jgi:hypothetical protein
LEPVGGLDEALKDDIFAVAIHDEPGQQVAFGKQAATQVRIDTDPGAIGIGGGESSTKKLLIDFGVIAAKKAESDLRFGTVERLADDTFTIVANADDGSRIDPVGVLDIAAVDPKMTPANTVNAAPGNPDFSVFQHN